MRRLALILVSAAATTFSGCVYEPGVGWHRLQFSFWESVVDPNIRGGSSLERQGEDFYDKVGPPPRI